MQRFGKLLFIALLTVVGSIFAITTAPPTADAAPAPRPLTQRTETVKLIPAADTYVDPGNLAGNYGNTGNLYTYAQGITAAIHSEALLRFDLSAIPAGSIIEQATLRLYQYEATGQDPWSLIINRVTENWDANTVTYRTKPASGETGLRLLSPLQQNVEVSTDLTSLVRSWRYQPFAFPNYGIMLYGTAQAPTTRQFYSAEGRVAPVLEVEYSPPPTSITIPYTTDVGKIDGICDTQNEYRNAISYQYIDHLGVISTLYLQQDDSFLYGCIEGTQDTFPLRNFSLYLDRNNGKEKYADVDDLALQVQVEDGAMSALEGTGTSTNTWIPSNYTDWVGVAKSSATAAEPEVVEYQMPLADVVTTCGQPFGIALYHQSVADSGIDYGWPTNTSSFSPSTWVQATLEHTTCPIQVCWESATNCQAANTAQVYQTAFPDVYAVDRAGYVIDRELIGEGQQIWAMVPVSVTENYTIYYTSGVPQTVGSAAYNDDPAGQMTLVVSRQHPLMVHNLDVSAQWYVQNDPAKEAWLREALTRTANLLYDYTDGQVTLGNITVYQSEDQWENADLKLHTSNTLYPNAAIGGVVTSAVEEVISSTLTISYEPGTIFMGSYWNRYGAPPNQPITVGGVEVPLAELQFDWADALAHELGHYLFFLFDTYRDKSGQSNLDVAEACSGSAMGDVYKEGNQGFVSVVEHWVNGCGQTEAYHMLNGRTEWETIQRWYPWVITPTGYVVGPTAPPINLTTVTFVAPSTPPGTPAASQLFDLDYQDNENSSGEARGFIFRAERLYEQGKPAKGSTQIQLTDAQLGDRLCVYDINDYAEGSDAPRHQFGCETIVAGDSNLALTKNVAWTPIVKLQQSGEQQITVQLTQTLPVDAQIIAKLYPEHGNAIAQELLLDADGMYSRTFTLPEAVPPLYLQLWVDETPTAPATRREVVADRGTGGGGAFGPARYFGGVLVLSSDGKATYESGEPLELTAGQSIAWQSMPGTPRLPAGKKIVGQSYRLDAYPPSLVAKGRVSIQFESETLLQAAGREAAAPPTLYYWDGNSWRALETTIITPVNAPDFVQSAGAPSEGTGIYAVMVDDARTSLYLPLVYR